MRRLYRSRSDSVVGGVCGGFGDYWGIDPVILRLILIFVTVITAFAPMLFLYLIAWVIIPLEPVGYEGRVYSRLYRSKYDRRIAGICGGLAQSFGIDSTVLRLVLVVLCIVTAVVPLALSYLVGWLVIPSEP